MLTHAEKLFKELETQLKTISAEQTGILSIAELSSASCEEALLKLKELVLKMKFKNESEEIYFFKKVKPKFTSKLYYFIMLFDLERRKVFKGLKEQQQYLENCHSEVDLYYQNNLEFVTYYRLDSTLLDDKYFVTNKINMHMAYSNGFFRYDKGFSTNRDSHIAEIIAKDMLSIYIIKELQKIYDEKNNSTASINSTLVWSDTKAALVLLIYALHSTRCFSNGKTELKEIAQVFSKLFNIELGDFYRTWAEIKLKKEPTKFLDNLKVAIENRINADMK